MSIKRIACIGTQHQLNVLISALHMNNFTIHDIDLIITYRGFKLQNYNSYFLEKTEKIKNIKNIKNLKNRSILTLQHIFSKINNEDYELYIGNTDEIVIQLLINNKRCKRKIMIEDGFGSYYIAKIHHDSYKRAFKHIVSRTVLFFLFNGQCKLPIKYIFPINSFANKYFCLSSEAFPYVENYKKEIISFTVYKKVLYQNYTQEQIKCFEQYNSNNHILFLESPLVENGYISKEYYIELIVSSLSNFKNKVIVYKAHPASNLLLVNEICDMLKNKNIEVILFKENINTEIIFLLQKIQFPIVSIISTSILYLNIFYNNINAFLIPLNDNFIVKNAQKTMLNIIKKQNKSREGYNK